MLLAVINLQLLVTVRFTGHISFCATSKLYLNQLYYSCCICLSFCIADLQIVGVEMFSVWPTTRCLVMVGETPASVRGITAQMVFLLSRSTLSLRTGAQLKLWRSTTCSPSLSTVLTFMPATRRWGAAVPEPSSTPGPNRQVRKLTRYTLYTPAML